MEHLTRSETVLELSLPQQKRQHKQNFTSASHLDRKQMQQPCANMKKHQQEDENSDSDAEQESSVPFTANVRPSASSSNVLLPSSSQRRSISMGDFRRVPAGKVGSEPPSASATAPSSKLVTPSSSMEFEAARRRLLEVEERQRVIREMERRLEELREVFVRSEQEVVEHGELVGRITSAAQQGELYVAENGQRLKKGLRFKRHRPTIVFSSMLGLRTCLPWPVKLK
ncbi:syntaxin-4-like [Carassius carassius]|uniref:syntaxin-4-like n=1 Tax=Carassius carassius TaxID=217509 RepID=UPI0028689A30|nr:syntaxin-4-like [Carassius carassius]